MNDCRQMAEKITLADLLTVATPLTLAGIIRDIDFSGPRNITEKRIREIAWQVLCVNVGDDDAAMMTTPGGSERAI